MTAQAVCCVLSHPGCQAQGITSQGMIVQKRSVEEEEGIQTQLSVLRKGNQLGRCEQAVVTPVGRTEGARDCPSGRLVRVHNSVSCSFYVPCVLLCSKPFDGFDLVQFSKIPETNRRPAHPPPKKNKNPTKQKAQVVSWLRFHRSSGKQKTLQLHPQHSVAWVQIPPLATSVCQLLRDHTWYSLYTQFIKTVAPHAQRKCSYLLCIKQNNQRNSLFFKALVKHGYICNIANREKSSLQVTW